jgi:hypothetical protein
MNTPSVPQSWSLPDPGPDWHVDVSAFFRYWRSIWPAADLLPGRGHFDPSQIKSLLPGVWLLDIQPAPFRMRYRLAGTRVVQYIGQEVTGRWMDEVHPDMVGNAEYQRRYEDVVRSRIPSWRRGMPTLTVLQDYYAIENVLVPLASDGAHVDMLAAFSVMSKGTVASS